MQKVKTFLKPALMPAFTVPALLWLSGCDPKSANQVVTTHPSPSAQTALIHGAGSTFAEPVYSRWFEAYRAIDPSSAFDYQATGSGDGIRQILRESVDFGGTDMPLSEQQMQVFEARYGCRLLHLPIALGADVPTYNIPEIQQQLNFTAEALAGMFLGRITKWDDPELVRANSGVALPSKTIVVVHRSDGSGTTFVWADYLSKVSTEWKQNIGASTSPGWPVGLGGEGNKGVAALVQKTAYSIGYVELTFAIRQKLAYGKVRNAAGEFVNADPAAVTAAAGSTALPGDFRISITNAPGKDAYPISSFTWMLVPERFADSSKAAAIKAFLNWAITNGQDQLEPIHYARLPNGVLKAERAAIEGIH